MGARQFTINLNPLASVCSERRRLVCSLAVTVLVVAASSITLRAQRETRIPLHAYMPPDFPASVNAVIPTPQYLPAGYELWRTFKHPDDGFRTGESEVEVQYQDPACWTRNTRCRLQVFVSPATQKPFSGTMGRSPEPVSLRIGTRTLEAQYFKGVGTGRPGGGTLAEQSGGRLEAGNFNALVFRLDDFMIGIRGGKQRGVGRTELIKVAKSLTYTAR
jgi:hypothetical protein